MIYNRSAILSLKLRSSVQLRKLSRAELFTRMQVTRTIEPVTVKAFKMAEEKRWREKTDDSPHGHPWHVSFHASQFPGDNPMACPRQALYRMMDFPQPEPTSRWLRMLADSGKGIEVSLVKAWHDAGILLSAPPDAKVQTGFEVPEIWLTGSVDAVIKPEGYNKPVPVEIKTKFQRVIDEMKNGRGPDESHVYQLKVQLALVRMYQNILWPDLDPVTHGFIFYMSRDNPADTAEFRVDLDERFFEIGAERLREWKSMFEEDVLPSKNPSKRHPMGWRWSYPPCQWCPFKKTCQLDHQAGETQLSNSIGVERAKLVQPDYDPQEARKRVKERWEKK